MKIDDIMASIEKDSVLDKAALDDESLRIPMLHSKYYRIFIEEFKLQKAVELEYATLKRDKIEYYLGKCPDQVYKDKPLDKKILRNEVDVYLESDPDLQAVYGRRCLQDKKLEMLEAFIKTLHSRGFNIKNAIEFLKFKNGVH